MNLLENDVNNVLQNFKNISSLILYGDNEIVKKFGKLAYGIDHLLIIKKKSQSLIITIQDKWESKSPDLKAIRHFINATEYINRETSYELFLSLFVSKKQMTKIGKDILKYANLNYPNDIYYDISENETTTKLANKVYEFINKFLLKQGITKLEQIPDKWTLFEHQKDALNTFKEKCLKLNKFKTGVISHPTGSGKTITALSIIGEYWKKYPERSVLWITERKDVLKSQFSNLDKFDKAIQSGFVQDYNFFNLKLWFRAKNSSMKKNKDSKPTFLITNTDSILYDDRYKLMDVNKFGLIIFDESHAAGAKYTYEMLKYYINNWVNLKCLIGFSATPIRTENVKFKRIADLFGDGHNINFISRMSLIDAIDKEIIVPPEFYWIETKFCGTWKKSKNNISFNNFINNIDQQEYERLISYLEKILYKSETKKAIAWSKSIYNADNWFNILKRSKNNRNSILADFKLFISHTGNIEKTVINKFLLYNNPALMICVGRCKEGFDDPKVDVGINLDAVQNRGTISFIQQTGRTMRNYKNEVIKKKKGIMMDTFTIMDEEKKIEQICEMIVGYSLFLKHLDINQLDEKQKNKEYMNILNLLKFNIKKNKVSFGTPGGNNINFKIKSTSLKKVDWKNLPKNVINKIENIFYQNGITYKIAKNIIKNYSIKSNINSKRDYYKICEKDKRLPKNPELVFKGKFINWIDYLSIERKYYNFDECKNRIKELINKIDLDSYFLDLYGMCGKLCQMDNKFPPKDLWIDYYEVSNLSELIVSHTKINLDDVL